MSHCHQVDTMETPKTEKVTAIGPNYAEGRSLKESKEANLLEKKSFYHGNLNSVNKRHI